MKNLDIPQHESGLPAEVQRTALPAESFIGAISLNTVKVRGDWVKTSSDGTPIPPEEQQGFIHFICTAKNY